MFLHPLAVESESQYESTNMLIRLGDSMWVLFLGEMNVADAMEINEHVKADGTRPNKWSRCWFQIFLFSPLHGEMIQFD